MRRLRNTVLTLSASAFLLCLCHSCNRENPAYNRENIKGAWIVYALDGTELSEQDWNVMVFSSAGTVLHFTEYQTGAVLCNNINFTKPAAVIILQNLISHLFQEKARCLLIFYSCLSFIIFYLICFHIQQLRRTEKRLLRNALLPQIKLPIKLFL